MKYADRIRAEQEAIYNAGIDLGRQQMWDMVQLVLSNSEYMGKDVFGTRRLLIIFDGIHKSLDEFWPAWVKCDDAEYYQEILDRRLKKENSEETFVPFKDRYPMIRQFGYDKRCDKK